MKVFIRALFIGALMFSALTLGQSRAAGQIFFFENPMLGETMPDFRLATTKRDNVSFEEYREGRPAIVFFWATWCPHCREQLSQIHRQWQEFEAGNIKVVLVDLDENPRAVRSYMEKYGMDFEVFIDEGGQLAEEFGVMGVPTFFFVAADGSVEGVEHALPEDYQQILMSEGS